MKEGVMYEEKEFFFSKFTIPYIHSYLQTYFIDNVLCLLCKFFSQYDELFKNLLTYKHYFYLFI